MLSAENKDTDQAAHSPCLISTFIISFLKNITKLATCKISIFQLIVSVAEHAGLSLTWGKPLRQVFSGLGPDAKFTYQGI